MKEELKMKDIAVLVLEIIILVIRMGVSPEEAVKTTAEKYGVEFAKLWNIISHN